MLKWLAGRSRSPPLDAVTDDPLATIRVDRPLEIYAVSRVNPIFDEEEAGVPAASSGYGHSSEGSSALLREDALTVLEQDVDYVKSILVAASPRRLAPIPEGKVDYCIPLPVWPPPAAPQQQDALLSDKEALRKLSVSLSRSHHLARMSRALSHSSGSSSGFSELTRTPPASARYRQLPALWETYCGAGVAAGDVRLQAKADHAYYPPVTQRLDFTLDGPRAEQLLLKIRRAKRHRFWCRLLTSLMGLVFFLLSVMVVSLLLTRGKRIFGPL